MASPSDISSPQQRCWCSLPHLMPKQVGLLNHNVLNIAYGVSLPSWPLRCNSSTSESVCEWEAFGLWPFPIDFRAFCFAFRTSRVPANSMEWITERSTSTQLPKQKAAKKTDISCEQHSKQINIRQEKL